MGAVFCATSHYLHRRYGYLSTTNFFIMDNDDEKTQMLKKAFAMFDQGKTGFIETNRVAAILNTMGQQFDSGELQVMIEEADKENTGKLNFQSFFDIAANFLEEEDDEAMQNELKEAFRLYDKEGNGYITTAVLREILTNWMTNCPQMIWTASLLKSMRMDQEP